MSPLAFVALLLALAFAIAFAMDWAEEASAELEPELWAERIVGFLVVHRRMYRDDHVKVVPAWGGYCIYVGQRSSEYVDSLEELHEKLLSIRQELQEKTA